jgi:hypothetical protein
VHLVTEGIFDGSVSLDDLNVQLTVDLGQGWNYIRLPDPSAGDFVLERVDKESTTLKSKNFWQSDRTFIGGGKRPIMKDDVHLLVFAGETGTSTLSLAYRSPD